MVSTRTIMMSIALLALGAPSIAPVAADAPVATASGGYHWTIEEDDIFGVEVVNRALTVNARRYADGSVGGVFQYQQVAFGEAFRFVLSVTCFNVYDGNRAKVGGVVEVSNDPTLPVGVFGWFQAIDGGEGEGADPDRSTLLGFGTEGENEAFCDSPDTPRFGPWDVTGNLQVGG